MESQNKKSNGNQLVLAIGIIVLIAIIAFAVSGKSKKDNNLKNQLPLTVDNIVGTWEKVEKEEEYRYNIDFEYGNHFIYSRFTGDEFSPSLVSIRGEYFIEQDMVSISFELEGQQISEKYYVALSKEKIVLSPIENGGEFLVGTYLSLEEAETDTGSEKSNENSSVVNQETTKEAQTSETTNTTDKQLNESVWKQAYRTYVDKAHSEGYESFSLIYIDDDNIPELYLCGSSESMGEKICTYKVGTVVALDLPRLYGTVYIEKSGLIKNSNGNMGYYSDSIYKLQNGIFAEIHHGTYETIERQSYSYNVYTMDGAEVSQTEYEQVLNDSFNPYQGKSPDMDAKDYNSFILNLSY